MSAGGSGFMLTRMIVAANNKGGWKLLRLPADGTHLGRLTQETELRVWFMSSSTVAGLGHVPETVAQLLRVFTSPQLETPRYDIIAIFR